MSNLHTDSPFPDDAEVAAGQAYRKLNNRAGYRRFSNQIVGGILFAFLLLSGALTVLGWQWDAELDDKRRKAKLPSVSVETALSRPAFSEVSNWSQDYSPFREYFTHRINGIKVKLFLSPGTDNTIVGNDGWFFYNRPHIKASYSGKAQISDEYLSRLSIYLKELQAWGEKQDIRILFAVAPNKHTVYGEYLPNWVSDKGRFQDLRAVEKVVFESAPEMYVPLLDALLERKPDVQSYYKTDTHWNWQGGEIGKDVVLNILKKDERLASTLIPEPEYGVRELVKENGNFAELQGVKMAEPTIRPWPVDRWNTSVDRDAMDRYRDMVHKRAGSLTVHKNNRGVSGPRLLMFGDSFGPAMRSQLTQPFEETLMINLWGVPMNASERFPLDVIADFDPDVILFVIVERRLLERPKLDDDPLSRLYLDLPTAVRKARLEKLIEASDREPLRPTMQVLDSDRIILPLESKVPESHEVVLELRAPEGLKGRILRVSREPDHLVGEMTDIRLSGGLAPQYMVAVLNNDRDGISLRSEDISEADLAMLDFTAYIVPRGAF